MITSFKFFYILKVPNSSEENEFAIEYASEPIIYIHFQHHLLLLASGAAAFKAEFDHLKVELNQ